jgi:hypothetical protein
VQNEVSLREAFFGWLATLGKILTTINLMKWHIILVHCCAYARRVGNLLIISYSIVRLLVLYGRLFSTFLG